MDQLQVAILRVLLLKKHWSTLGTMVPVESFTNSNAAAIYEHIMKMHEENGEDLDPGLLRLNILAMYTKPSERRDELLDLVEHIANVEVSSLGSDYAIRCLVGKFASRELALQAATYIATHGQSDKFDVRFAADLLSKAVEARQAVDLDVIDFSNASLTLPARPVVVSLGLSPELELALGGGVGAGELALYMAPPQRGKTSYLWHSVVAAAKEGVNVLGITKEISAAKCIRRIDQCLTHLSSAELVGSAPLALAARKKLPGKIWIKDLSYTRTDAEDIVSLVRQMRQRGNDVQYVMIDYLALMEPIHVGKRDERRHSMGNVGKELRQASVELGVPILSAWQVNRAGSDTHVLSERDIAECWEIVMHADIILGLNQGPIERENNVMRINIIKQRESTRRPVEYHHSDLDHMRIHALERDGENDREVEVQTVGAGDRSRLRNDGTGAEGAGQSGSDGVGNVPAP